MRIFLSYRRADTKDVVGHLATRLMATPGVSKVFMDVDAIDRGENFVAAIRKSMRQCKVRLVVIGPDWASLKDDGGRPRILAEDDMVAMEVREALTGAARVIPVLVNGAAMPPAEALPPDLSPLTQLNAAPLRHETFDSDFVLLTNAIFNRKSARGASAYFERHPAQAAILRGLVGFAVSAIVLIAGLMVAREFGLLRGALGGSREAAVFIAGAVMLAGTFGPVFLLGRRRRTV